MNNEYFFIEEILKRKITGPCGFDGEIKFLIKIYNSQLVFNKDIRPSFCPKEMVVLIFNKNPFGEIKYIKSFYYNKIEELLGFPYYRKTKNPIQTTNDIVKSLFNISKKINNTTDKIYIENYKIILSKLIPDFLLYLDKNEAQI